MKIAECSFDDILPFWAERLWPERRSAIEPFSCIDINGKINISIADLAEPVFFKSVDNKGETIGVVSAQFTDSNTIRQRGLWVDESERGRSLGRKLCEVIYNYALDKQAENFWTMARFTNLQFYEKIGFAKICQINTYEYGPHYIMKKNCYV